MTAAEIEPSEAVAVRRVLRSTGGILRRHGRLFAVLGVLLALLPGIGAVWFAGPLSRLAIPDGLGGLDRDRIATLRSLVGLSGVAMAFVSSFTFSVTVIVVALEGDRGGRSLAKDIRSTTLRWIAFALAFWFGSIVLLFITDEYFFALFFYYVLGCWTAVLPIRVAERPSLRELFGRTWSVLRVHRRFVAGLVVIYAGAAAGLNDIELHGEAVFGAGQASLLVGRVATEVSAVTLGVVVECLFVAYYREVLRIERATPSKIVLAAFE